MVPAVVAAALAQVEQRNVFDIVRGVPGWVLFGLVIFAFLVFGLRDLVRLSWTRISAISSVCFQESIRRRVLWITPLAIVGAVVVSQLQNALDPQDAIRQTTKVCLFATGLVVTLTAIILACTNLPKEIDNRVIYTIVSKPTTRLEIILGKVWGFAKVSAAILLIMGVFTFLYLQVRAYRLSTSIAAALEVLPADAPSRPTLEHYRQAGLLNAKAMGQPDGMQVLAEAPLPGKPRVMAGGQGQQFGITFKLSPDDLPLVEAAYREGGRMALVIDMPVEVREPTALEMETIRATAIPTEPVAGAGEATTTAPATAPSVEDFGPALPTTQEAAPAAPAATQPAEPVALPKPVVQIAIRNQSGDPIVTDKQLNDGSPIILPPSGRVEVPIAAEALARMYEEEDFVVLTEARSPAVKYTVGDNPVALRVIKADGSTALEVEPGTKDPKITAAPGRFGQQIVGGEEGKGGVAVFNFDKGAKFEGDAITFEVRAGIERAGDGSGESEQLPVVQLSVHNLETGTVHVAPVFTVETNRISYVDVPRSAFPADGARFDVLVRVLTPDQWLGMKPQSIALATGARTFSFNLLKSLLILWLMSVLVVAIAVFCSTFVSWPIAVVLTLVLLLGRWGVDQITDATGGGLQLGATITSQTEDVTRTKVIRESVDALGRLLELVAAFLPDVSQFQATADIERGISVPAARLAGAGWVLLGYGVPIVILAYLVLKRKEVAP